MSLTMPDRLPTDGEISLRRLDDGEHLALSCEHKPCGLGSRTTVMLSEYNAWRAFGLLSVMLELPLPKHVSKAIKLTVPDGELGVTVGAAPGASLGERMATGLLLGAGVVEQAAAEVGASAKKIESMGAAPAAELETFTRTLTTGHALSVSIPVEGAVENDQHEAVYTELVGHLRSFADLLETAGEAGRAKLRQAKFAVVDGGDS